MAQFTSISRGSNSSYIVPSGKRLKIICMSGINTNNGDVEVDGVRVFEGDDATVNWAVYGAIAVEGSVVTASSNAQWYGILEPNV